MSRDQVAGRVRSCLSVALSCATVLLAGMSVGCAELPPEMQVTKGRHPANVDKSVRFRTTYYFRVFDYCYDIKKRSQSIPVSDSLYRFVMTGKANPFAATVNFESGTLTAAQVDPFGATVEPDPETGKPRFVSEAEVQQRAHRAEARQELEQLLDLKRRLTGYTLDKTGKATMADASSRLADTAAIAAVDAQIKQAIDASQGPGKLDYKPSELKKYGAPTTADGLEVNVCPPGTEIERGFQIVGPQGVRTFNQNERLLMAMSSQPGGLLAALSQVSDRVKTAKGSRLQDSAALLALVREQLLVSEISHIAETATATTPEEAAALLKTLAEKLDSSGGAS